jgi:hypothetical protein
MIQELIAIAGSSNKAYNGGGQVVSRVRHVGEGLRHATADFLPHEPEEGRTRVVPGVPERKRRKAKKPIEDKRSTRKALKEGIPLGESEREGNDEDVLRYF